MGLRYLYRRSNVKKRLKRILTSENDENIERILQVFDEYTHGLKERNNRTEQKLRVKRSLSMKRISAALRLTIEHHGPILKENIGSAAKRIYGQLVIQEEIFHKDHHIFQEEIFHKDRHIFRKVYTQKLKWPPYGVCEYWELIPADLPFYNAKIRPNILRDGGLFAYHTDRRRWYHVDPDCTRFSNLHNNSPIIRKILTRLRDENVRSLPIKDDGENYEPEKNTKV